MEGGTVPLFNLRTSRQRQEFLVQSKVSSWVTGGGATKADHTYDIHDARAKEKHRGILMMVIMDLQPWSMVNDPGFLYFSSQMDPHYKVASDKFYRGLLDKAFKKGVTKVEEKLNKDDPEFMACQLDGWSSYRHGYIGLLVNYITPSWKRVSLCLSCGPYDGRHTGENLGNWLEEKLEKWKVLDKVTVTVSDTASNMLKMMEFLPSHIVHNGCLNHVLQLSINHEILEKPEVKNIIFSVRAFTNYAAISTLLSTAVRSKQEELGWSDADLKALVQDVKTRWNSTFDMLERFVTLQEAIKKVLEDDDWKDKILVKSGNNAGKVVKFSNNDWKVMERIVKVLGPFKEATLKLSAASACISQAIPTVTSLLHTLKPAHNTTDLGVRDLKRRLTENIMDRLDYIEESDIYALATILDPRYVNFLSLRLFSSHFDFFRFKNCYFRSNDAKNQAEKNLLNLLKAEVAAGPPSRQNSMELVEVSPACDGLEAAFLAVQQGVRRTEEGAVKDTEEDILKRYLNAKLEKSCLAWWKIFEEKGKECKVSLALCRLARQFLTPPPTSTDCERLFSVAGQVLDEKRAKMLPENLEKILFLRENILVTNYNLDW